MVICSNLAPSCTKWCYLGVFLADSPRFDMSEFWKATKITEEQARCFAAMGIANPENLEKYMW